MKTVRLNIDWLLEHHDLNIGLARKAYLRDYSPSSDAMIVSLPCTAQAALVEHGRAGDPCAGYQSDDLKWPEAKEWWYYCDFSTPEHSSAQRVSLRFEGVTYRAEVWVNSELVGQIEGMFREDEFDITDRLTEAGANRVAVRVRAQEMALHDDRGSDIRGKVRGQGVVMQSMYRWNWVPHIVAVGLWRPVSIVVRDPVEIEDVRVRTISVHAPASDDVVVETAPAEIELAWRVKNLSSSEAETVITYEVHGDTFEGSEPLSGEERATVAAGSSVWVKRRLHLADARLWWCNGLGEASLYRLHSRINSSAGPKLRGESRSTVFGVREIKFVPNDESAWVTQVSGHSARPWTMIHPLYDWILSLNGRRVFLKGSNWVHADVLLRLESQRYERLLLPAKAGGLNFLRVWGGSLAETDDFYNCCDRFGILCWQEFWLACENYPALDRALLTRCARDTVRRLHNHPSLVFYSGGNEFEPDNPQNRSAVDALASVVTAEDGHREFRRSSPYKGDKHGGLVPTPLGMRNKYLDILPGDKRQVLFRSETAVGRSAPSFGTLKRFINSQWPLDEKQFRHFFGVPSEFIGFANEYAANDEFYAAVMANHFAHIRILQVNLEYCRSQMFRCGGHLNWQYAVPWPCLHREIVDWWGVPKPAFYHYGNACSDPALFLDFERYLWNPGEMLSADVFLVNDASLMQDVQCTFEILDVTGRIWHTGHWRTDASANTSARLGAIDWQIDPELASRSLLIFTRIQRDDATIYEGCYWIAVSSHEHDKDALFLDGTWERADGTRLSLPGNDMTLGDDGFDSIVQKSVEKDFEQTAEERSSDHEAGGRVCYRRTFSLPRVLRDQPLELFCAGIEASYEISVNGTVVASDMLRGSKLDLGAMAHVPYRQQEPDARIDAGTDYKFFSDPITLPKLTPCFADLPVELLKNDGENEIELHLWTDCQKVVSQSLIIRRPTVNREHVRDYLREGILFKDLRAMPPAEIAIESQDGRLLVQNCGAAPAMLVLLDVESDGSPVPTDDNALMMRPGDQRMIGPLGGGRFPAGARVTVRGWNVPVAEYTVSQ